MTQIRAELLKLRTVRSTWVLAIAGLALTVAFVILPLALSGQAEVNIDLGGPADQRSILAGASQVTIFALVLGLLAVTGEHRHGTITPTLLAEPRRLRVLGAKLVVYGAVGLALAMAAMALTAAIALPWFAAAADGLALSRGEVAALVGGLAVAGVAWSAWGVAIGAIVTNQALAIVGTLVWAMAAESILVGVLPQVARFLPAAAAGQVITAGHGQLFGRVGSLLVVAAWTAVLVALAIPRFANRDVT